MNKLLLCGASLGLISVIMGALGDHAFDLSLDDTASFEAAIRYNMLYAILIVILAIAPARRALSLSGMIFTVGVVLFSFSIYAALITGIDPLTYMTPLGGIIIMAGWVSLIYAALKSKP